MITPRQKYNNAILSAKKRNIDWQFTYEQWLAWWGDDFNRRGPRADDLCMARIGDIGPYHPDNVVKFTVSQNVSEMRMKNRPPMLGKTHSESAREKMKTKATGRKYSPEINKSKGRSGPRGPMSQKQRDAISRGRLAGKKDMEILSCHSN